ncbi:hypothetical protein ScPMuIL_013772 [Solemya velum]
MVYKDLQQDHEIELVLNGCQRGPAMVSRPRQIAGYRHDQDIRRRINMDFPNKMTQARIKGLNQDVMTYTNAINKIRTILLVVSNGGPIYPIEELSPKPAMYFVNYPEIVVLMALLVTSRAHNVFEIIQTSMNNSDAQEACHDRGMELAILPTWESQCRAKLFIKTHGNTWSYWIGLYYHSGVLIWADGSTDTWWQPTEITRKTSKPCYVISGPRRSINEVRCGTTFTSTLCGRDGTVKIMKNLPNSISMLRTDLQSYIFNIETEDPFNLNADVQVTLNTTFHENPFRISAGSVYIPKNTELKEDTYIVEVKAAYSCGGEEKSFLCVSVFDVVIGGATTPNPLCLFGQTGVEPLHFLIPERTRDRMCTALPLLDYNDPEKIIIAVLYLQFTIERRMFPYIFKILSYDKVEVVIFLYRHCGLHSPYPSTTPAALTTESGLQTTFEPASICLEIENNTIKFPESIMLGNKSVHLTTIEDLDSACAIDHTSVIEAGITPSPGSEALLSSHEPYSQMMSSEPRVTCLSWVTTSMTADATGDRVGKLPDDIPKAWMQKGDAPQQADTEDCGVFSCWSESNQVGLIVVACIGVGVIAATSLLVYKKVGKNRIVPYPDHEAVARSRPPTSHIMNR